MKIQTAKAYYQLMRFDKPIGWLLLMWPTLSALWLAASATGPSLFRIGVFALGVWTMRAAGCVINDMADAQFDKAVARTAQRPLASGALTRRQAASCLLFLLVLALILLLQLPKICWGLAIIGLLLTFLYPFTKRFFKAPQLILGIVFNWGIIVAVAAELNTVPGWVWIFYLSQLGIVVAYDTIYALMDKEDDLSLPIHSLAITLGHYLYPVLLSCYVLATLGFLLVGLILQLSWPFYLGLSVHTSLLLWQWYRLAILKRETYFQAFAKHHWAGFILFMSIVCCRF
jgi:4-hydroxybenzoate polyprenyltransferase